MKKILYFLILFCSAYIHAGLYNFDKVEIDDQEIRVKNLALSYKHVDRFRMADGSVLAIPADLLKEPVRGVHVFHKFAMKQPNQTTVRQEIDKQHLTGILLAIVTAEQEPGNPALEGQIWQVCKKHGYPREDPAIGSKK